MAEAIPPYDPELYLLVHRGTPGDLGWYVDATEGCRRVLELGCGGGRILEGIGAAHPDVELVGLDVHPGLLARAQERLGGRAALFEADMRSFCFERRFDAVIIPYSGFWCLGTDADRAACLTRVRDHLEPRGRLLLDAYAADAWHVGPEEEGGTATEFLTVTDEGDGQGWEIWEETTWRPEEKAFTARYRHERRGPLDARGARVDGVIEHRYLLADELRGQIEASRMTVTRLQAGFHGERFDVDATHLVLEAEARE